MLRNPLLEDQAVMYNLLPGFICSRYRQNISKGRITGYIMSIDIKGFTDITEKLMSHGIEGAEVLTGIINRIFSPCISIIQNHKGFISTFEGDAFTAFFHVKSPVYSYNSAAMIFNFIEKNSIIETKYGRFAIYVKAGMSFGRSEYRIIRGKDYDTFLFSGDPVKRSADAQGFAESMQIIADRSYYDRIGHDKCRRIGQDYFILDISDTAEKNYEPDHYNGCEGSDSTIFQRFFPREVIELKEKGEFRNIVSCMVNFRLKGRYLKAIEKITEMVYRYGGYFNRAAFGDKGAVILVLFGAPVARENMLRRASDFMLGLRDIPNFCFRAGMTSGRAFTGFLGSPLRAEYTAIGSMVNLSSRLMTRADWGEILIDENLFNNLKTRYDAVKRGTYRYKGFNRDIGTFSLEGQIKQYNEIYHGDPFIGRERELMLLDKALEPVYNGRFAGIIYIDGPAGIGKTRFLEHFRRTAEAKTCSAYKISFLYLPCDEILKKSFNPFIYFLERYFSQNPENTKRENTKLFRAEYEKHIEKTDNEEIRSELIRTESIIASLLGLEYEDSLITMLDARGKFDNTIIALKNFILSLGLLNPLILIIDDSQWIDEDSLKLIKRLINNIEGFPIAIISACRPSDDGSLFEFFRPDKETETERISIGKMLTSDITPFLEAKLQSRKIPRETRRFITGKCDGNPFFLEQIILYIKENNLLDENMRLTASIEEIPQKISQIVISRIDKLSFELKEIIKTASVLGREFAVKVLRGILHNLQNSDEYRLADILTKGDKEQVWHKLNELKYIFHHALIRDTVYNIQLKERLRLIHNLAGEVIESLYENDLENHYEELADHYDRAENNKKARFYLDMAAEGTSAKYQNSKAIYYYTRLIKYLDREADIEKVIKTLCNIGYLYVIDGNLKDSEKKYIKALDMAKRWDYRDQMAVAYMNLSEISIMRGDIDKALSLSEKGLNISSGLSDMKGYIMNLRSKGNALTAIADLDKAYKCFHEILTLIKDPENETSYASTLGSIGNILRYRNEYREAMKYYKEAGRIFKKTCNKRLYAVNTGNIGVLYKALGKLDSALRCFEAQYRISKEIGYKKLSAMSVGNMGNIYSKRNELHKAMDYFEISKNIFKEIGDRKGYGRSLGHIAALYEKSYDYENAVRLYEDQKKISEEIGDKYMYANSTGNLGSIYTDIGQYDKALEYSNKAAETCKNIGNILGCSIYLENMGEIYLKLGDYKKAMKCYQDSRKYAVRMKDPASIGIIDRDIGYLYYLQKKYDIAMNYCKKALKLLDKSQYTEEYCKALCYTAMIYEDTEDSAKALEYYIKAEPLLMDISDKRFCILILKRMSEAYRKMGNKKKAEYLLIQADETAEAIKNPLMP